jgi:DNA (cytosine-5)-methyltransferase 1
LPELLRLALKAVADSEPTSSATEDSSQANSSHRADAESYVAFRTSGNCGAWETGDRTDALTTSTDPNSHIIAHTLRGEGFDASEDGTGRGIPLVPVAFDATQITSKTNRCNPQPGDPCHPLAASSHPPTIAFTAKDYGGDAQEDLSPTLRAGGFTDSHANAGVMPAIAYPIDMRQASRGEKFTNNRKEGSSGGAPGTGVGENGDPAPTVAASHVPAVVHFQGRGSNLDVGRDVAATLGTNADRASGGAPCVAYDMRGREGGAQFEGPHDTANVRAASGGSSCSYVQQGWAVRRLTPVECARLQGFPDQHSRIPWRGKSEDECPDGPQYKTFGNSMAVKCMRWLGERIEMAIKRGPARPQADLECPFESPAI